MRPLCLLFIIPLVSGAQFPSQPPLAAGRLLVASEKLGDPNFSESVVLLLHYDDDGTLGIVINRRSEVALSKIFPDEKRVAGDPAYLGGPVEIRAVQALFRSKESKAANEKVTKVVGDVYSSGSKKIIEQLLHSRAAASQFRIYLGYAGWQPGQLEAEIDAGAWSVMKASSETIFDADPDSLWSRLNRLLTQQIAVNLPPASPQEERSLQSSW